MTPQDRIRTLTRLACELAWCRLNGGGEGDESALLAKLRRFVKRNVGDAPGQLSLEMVGVFVVDEFDASTKQNVFKAWVNGRLLVGEYEVEVGDLPTCACLVVEDGSVEVTDALLLERLTQCVNNHLEENAYLYIERDEESRADRYVDLKIKSLKEDV